jgi:exodeoxyribonuclease VII small subunit
MPPKPAPAKAVDTEDLPFEEILTRLEGVVASLEAGDVPLEQALAAFERGVSLSRLGARRLDEAERRVEVLLRDADGARTRPLETEDDSDEEREDDG